MTGLRIAGAAVVLAFAAMPAGADAIDGQWCGPQGGNLLIDGPKIRIMSGRTISGDYDRHAFHYVVPDGDSGAGTEIFMRLRSEEEMWLRQRAGGVDGVVETWRRCEVTS